MKRAYTTFIGIDLGGARGKTTAVAVIKASPSETDDQAIVLDVAAKSRGANQEPWTDDALLELIAESDRTNKPCVAIDAPLTMPTCIRCVRPVCPGQAACEDIATMWLESRGAELVRQMADDSLIALSSNATVGFSSESLPQAPSVLFPYVHRCTEIELHYARGVFPRERVGQRGGPVANRALHLVRRLESRGFALHESLIEVSPRATVAALFGDELARGYKRDADPWQTRATILESIGIEMRFDPRSRLSREQCLANDNCFEALLSAFTGYLFARDGWSVPDGPFSEDGWIFAPPA